ncbi:MAG: BrnT family toxin [Gammaproteobacteria bacterium]|nr:BrnT family toxin [Gammaproteobacteria bacterium]MBU1654327.1 BrnT family toxin [Gammaproteobacteria bacterium]MBU1961198.1 BrnT family toxin [Gammaproteobacteria bacterium]
MEFGWDKNKAWKNEKKHCIAFSEATTIFGDPLELTISDPDHSSGEYRFLSIGRSSTGKLLVVSYTETEQGKIRIISARMAAPQEERYYEQNH